MLEALSKVCYYSNDKFEFELKRNRVVIKKQNLIPLQPPTSMYMDKNIYVLIHVRCSVPGRY